MGRMGSITLHGQFSLSGSRLLPSPGTLYKLMGRGVYLILLMVFLNDITSVVRTKAAPAVVQEPRLFNVAQDFLDAPLVRPSVAARFVAEVGGRRAAVGVRDGIGVATGGLGICHRLGNLTERREDLKTSH